MAFCVLCQQGHEMTDNCMKNVVCRECGQLGHLSINLTRCSKNKPVSPTIQASQLAPVLTHTPARPSQDQVTTQVRTPMNSNSDKVPEPASFYIRHVFDTDRNDNSKVESELRNIILKGEKRTFSDLTSGVLRKRVITDILSVDESQPSKRPRYHNQVEMESSELHSKMDSDAEAELVIDISSDSEGDQKEISLDVGDESLKVLNKKQLLFSNTKYQLLFVHIETFRSRKSSCIEMTQIGCCSGSSSSDFFCAIEPSGLSKYLSRYKLGGDLLRALHMTEEEDGRFQFRSHFEIVTDPRKRIYCISEKDAIMNLLEFLKDFSHCVLVTVDEDTMALLAKKLRDIAKEAFKETVVGYTYWKRILKHLYVPGYNEVELEEFYNEITETDLPNYLSTKDIATILNKSVDQVICKYWQSGSLNTGNKFIFNTSKKIEELPLPVGKSDKCTTLKEDLEVYSSFRPSVSTIISAEKREQITLSSESESEKTTFSANEILRRNVKVKVKKESDCPIEVNSDSEDGETNYVRSFRVNNRIRCKYCLATYVAADFLKHMKNLHPELISAEPVRTAADLVGQVKPSQLVGNNMESASKEIRQLRVKTGKTLHCFGCANVKLVNIGKHMSKCHSKQEVLIECSLCFGRFAPLDVSIHLKASHPSLFLADKSEVLSVGNYLESASRDIPQLKVRTGKMIQCPVCTNRTEVKIVNIRKHMTKFHSIQEGVLIECWLCSREFAPPDVWHHLKDYHPGFFLVAKSKAFKKKGEKVTGVKTTATGALHVVKQNGNRVPINGPVTHVWSQIRLQTF